MWKHPVLQVWSLRAYMLVIALLGKAHLLKQILEEVLSMSVHSQNAILIKLCSKIVCLLIADFSLTN